jgi:uncharacterized protein YrzB (UPF0473 family)
MEGSMKNKITIVDKDNKEIECEVVLAYEDPNRKRGYFVYKDGSLDDNGEEKLFASYYDSSNPNDLDLKEIETQEEINMLMEILENMGR